MFLCFDERTLRLFFFVQTQTESIFGVAVSPPSSSQIVTSTIFYFACIPAAGCVFAACHHRVFSASVLWLNRQDASRSLTGFLQVFLYLDVLDSPKKKILFIVFRSTFFIAITFRDCMQERYVKLGKNILRFLARQLNITLPYSTRISAKSSTFLF